jgi:hypothetical protein
MVEKQVRYNRGTKTGELEAYRHKWNFMIIDEREKIKEIREQIYSQLQPIVDLKELYSGEIKSSRGLNYDFFSFSTSQWKFSQPAEISTLLIKDSNLTAKDDIGLERYLQTVIKGRM